MSEKLKLRSEIAEQDTWNLQDYYESDEAWLEACDALAEEIPGFQKFQGKLKDSGKMLLECLQFDEKIGDQIERIFSYAHQKQDQDTTVSRYQEFFAKAYDLYMKIVADSSYVSVEMAEIPEDRFEIMVMAEPGLELYRRAYQQVIRNKEHMKSAIEERLLAEANAVTGAASDIFKMFNNADIKFAPAVDSEGNSHEVSHGTFVHYLENKDRTLRKSAYESVYTAYGDARNTLAAMFYANLKEHSFYARTRGYEGPIDYALFNNNIPVYVYNQLVDAIHEALPVMYRYVTLRKKILGVDDLHLYDVYVPISRAPQRKYTFEEAKAIVLEALKPMGEEYLGLLRKGFEERWIDVYENKGKRSGAYSTSSYSVHPYVLLNFNGSLDSVFTLAHEMGHALHSWYSNNNQPYAYANYRIFVAEVASTCNEALLYHYFLTHAESDEEKAYILNQYLDGFKGTIFRQTMFAEFEKITHEMVWNGEALTADRLCEIYKKLNEDYFGPDMIVDDYIAMEWSRIPHFYTPFYVYQYATGFTAAIALSKHILEKGPDAVEAYKSFLKGGCSKDPIDLLKIAGVDMGSAEPIRDAMKVFESLLDQLEQII